MLLLKTYLPDIFEMVSETEDTEYNFMSFFTSGSFYEDFQTAVHETYHIVSNNKLIYKGSSGTYIPINGKEFYVYLDRSKIFETEEMATTIPSRLRTFRYDLYTSGDSFSNYAGAIGCLEEMSAYYWGLSASAKLINYLLNYDNGESLSFFAVNVANDMCAYLEFKLYILDYLIYAQKNHPEAYSYLLNSKDFAGAYTELCKAFESRIREIKEQLPEINKHIAEFGAELIMTTDSFSYYENGIFRKGAPLNDYTLLSKELAKSKYTELEDEIKKHQLVLQPQFQMIIKLI